MEPETYLPFARPDIGSAEIDAVRRVLESGWITTGPEAARFEAEFRTYVGASHAVAVNSCTAALHLGLEAMGVGEGDEVITSPYTFASTGEVIRYLRGDPVFVDVEADTLNLDPALVAAAVSPRTKAILPVHVAGQPADLDAIYRIAGDHRLAVLEDCAHALPAWYRGRLVGADLDRTAYPGVTAHASCFSFYATKALTTGEGGMLCTGSESIASRTRIMALHGMSLDAWKRYSEAGSWYYEVVAPGFKYNMSDVAAAMGVVQLQRLEAMWERRRELSAVYTESLSGCAELDVPTEVPGTVHAWHLFALRLNLERLSIDRAGFVEALKVRRIGTSVHFIPLHLHPYYRDLHGHAPDDFPVAYRQYMREISLPIYSRMTVDDARRVAAAVLDVVAEHRTG
jgi:dTDP-4-amino-4,6-dideoxygalactose transaminase